MNCLRQLLAVCVVLFASVIARGDVCIVTVEGMLPNASDGVGLANNVFSDNDPNVDFGESFTLSMLVDTEDRNGYPEANFPDYAGRILSAEIAFSGGHSFDGFDNNGTVFSGAGGGESGFAFGGNGTGSSGFQVLINFPTQLISGDGELPSHGSSTGTGSMVEFFYNAPGTDGPIYSLVDSGVTSSAGFTIVAAVPEPSAMATMLFSFCLLGVRRRRKN